MAEFKDRLKNLLRNRWVSHFFFWIAINAIFAYTGSLFGGDLSSNFINLISVLPVQMMVTYVLVYWQIPKMAMKQKWLIFMISLAIISFLAAVLARLCVMYIAEPILFGESPEETLWQIFSDPLFLYEVYAVTLYLPAIIFFLIKMTRERFREKEKVVLLEKEKNQAELNFLKAQTNPHFLFNTLNNLYALAETRAPETSEMILKLSEILNYTLYECMADRVPVKREWELIEHYADLQALRQNRRMDIRLVQDISNPECQIAPLILISLVENAFKFGLKGPGGNSSVHVGLKLQNDQLEFEVANTYAKDHKVGVDESGSGVGLKNVKRQLALIYPDKHKLSIEQTGSLFSVHLNLSL